MQQATLFDLADLVFMPMQLPASFFAYRKQQHRWTCGPVQLWRKAAVDIWASSLPLFSKMDLIICYFGIRKFATHWVSAGFFCGLVPLSVFTPEVNRPLAPPPSPVSPSPSSPWSTGCSKNLQTTALFDLSLLAGLCWARVALFFTYCNRFYAPAACNHCIAAVSQWPVCTLDEA